MIKMTDRLEELSETERKAFDMILEAGELPIMELSHQLQGAVGKLKSKGLIEIFRKRHTWKPEGREFSKTKMTNWVKVIDE